MKLNFLVFWNGTLRSEGGAGKTWLILIAILFACDGLFIRPGIFLAQCLGTIPGSGLSIDSAEKPYECFDGAQHERKISNDFTRSSVRPEALEG